MAYELWLVKYIVSLKGNNGNTIHFTQDANVN